MADNSDATAEAARAQAEARRKRIMEKANQRMGLVSGEQVQDDSAKEASSANAARIRAARQRARRKKAAGSASSEPAAPDAPVAKPEAGQASDVNESEADVPSNDAPRTPESKDATTTAATPESVEKDPEVTVEPKQADTTKHELTTNEEGAGKKKYVGVAKMRRKMILQKRREESESGPTSTTKNRETVLERSKSSLRINTIPIYMHFLTVLLLFLSGLDVGLQNFREDVTVHKQDALNQYGIPLVHRELWVSKKSGTDVKLEELRSGSSEIYGDDSSDEFHDEEEEKEPNIDPLFRIDLDELTKGPGILNQLARGAIAVHRLILKLVYDMPTGFFQYILGIPKALLNTPPVLCIVALFIRQILAKQVLGARLPSAENEERGKESGAIDLLAMMKQWVTGFLSTAFPTIVGLYDAFAHLRADMYIILCGVFCGLAWSHQFSGDVVELGRHDEL